MTDVRFLRCCAAVVMLLTLERHHWANAEAVVDMVQAEGYTIEAHAVRTADNYTVVLYHMPPIHQDDSADQPSVVLLMHGLFNSAADWLLFGPRYSLGYILADAGYDVWLGNVRGTRPARRLQAAHRPAHYWSYSFHEIGLYDVPAMVDYALFAANRSQRLHYIGHSQGCTAFFIMLAMRPEYAQRIASMHALAPAVQMGRSRAVGPLLGSSSSSSSSSHDTGHNTAVVGMIGAAGGDILTALSQSARLVETGGEVSMTRIPQQLLLRLVGPLPAVLVESMCGDRARAPVTREWCAAGVFRVLDTASPPLRGRYAANVLQNTPDSASARQILHFGQLIRSGRFQQFDFGEEQNRRRYGGRVEPPAYGLANLTTDVFVMFGETDFVTTPEDVQRMCDRLGGAVRAKTLVKKFNHFDFIYSRRAVATIYKPILGNLREYGVV